MAFVIDTFEATIGTAGLTAADITAQLKGIDFSTNPPTVTSIAYPTGAPPPNYYDQGNGKYLVQLARALGNPLAQWVLTYAAGGVVATQDVAASAGPIAPSGLPSGALSVGSYDLIAAAFAGAGVSGGAITRSVGDVEALSLVLTTTGSAPFSVSAASVTPGSGSASAVVVDSAAAALSHTVSVLLDLTGAAEGRSSLRAAVTLSDGQTVLAESTLHVKP